MRLIQNTIIYQFLGAQKCGLNVLFVCLFGLWAGVRSLTDSPRVLIHLGGVRRAK